MISELPLFRLGLAGFTAEQQQAIGRVLDEGASDATLWEIGELGDADAWWLNGARTQALGSDRVRVASGQPGGRSIQLQLPDIDRPMALANPLPLGMQALSSFDLASASSMKATLRQFETYLAPQAAQFCLAASIVAHQSALGAGKYELCLQSQVLAVVDMQGEAAVRATLGPVDFEGTWWRRSESFRVPESFVRTSLAQLMWQYTLRTQRDILPKHYRTGPLYFRRAPQLPQRLLRDSHLLILRELMLGAATFEELQQRCGFTEARLAHELASLYFVGAITSNPKRAAPAIARAGGADADLDPAPSEFPPARRPTASDLTVPALLQPQ